MKVGDWFQNLLSKIQPLQTEIDKAERHAQTIKARIEKDYGLRKFLIVGSHSRGTAIRRKSDVDYFALIKREDARHGDGYTTSTAVLGNIKKCLQDRFNSTDMRIDGQAVVVQFGGGDFSVDVVPAIFWEMDSNNWPIYFMPDGNGDWMKTGPEIHNQFIKGADEKSRGKLKFVSQLLKYWRGCRNPAVPISAFHMELVLADYGLCTGIKSYSQCLTEAFQLLAQRECRAYRDPKDISGNVNAVRTEAQRGSVLSHVVYARDHAKTALAAENQNDSDEAIRQWKIVFNI